MARRYARDNRGRFAPKGTGATARGGRLKTARGSKRQTQTMQSSAAPRAGAIRGKVKRDPSAAGKIGKAKPVARRPDQAEVNIKGRFTGQAGKRFDASIDRAVKEVQASERARLMKPKAQVRGERAAAAEAKRQAAAAKPKRTRTPDSLRMSRAKQIEKRRGMNISNPAAWRPESAGRMAANAARTQERAMAFYKGAASAKPPKGSQAATKIEQAKGRTAVLTQSKNALNQQLKSLNAQIKAAGPSAGGLRLQKLQIQDRLAQVRRDITASKAAARG